MPLGHRSARRRGMIVGAAVSSSRNAKRQAATTQSAPTAPVPAAAEPVDTTVEQIIQLATLRDQGILTEEEFAAKKKQILGI